MRQLKLVAALLMCCSAASACKTTEVVAEPLRPDRTDPQRFVCEPAGTRPRIPAEDVIDLDRARAASTVPDALAIVQEEVRAYVASVRAREGIVANYVVQIEGKLFTCGNNMEWQRDFYARLPADP